MKLMRLGYLVYSLDNCAMKLCIEISLRSAFEGVVRVCAHITLLLIDSLFLYL